MLFIYEEVFFMRIELTQLKLNGIYGYYYQIIIIIIIIEKRENNMLFYWVLKLDSYFYFGRILLFDLIILGLNFTLFIMVLFPSYAKIKSY